MGAKDLLNYVQAEPGRLDTIGVILDHLRGERDRLDAVIARSSAWP